MTSWLGKALAQDIHLGLPFGDRAEYTTFNAYFTALISFAVTIASLVAVLVIVYAGYVYTQSQGQADKVSFAKELIAGALTGLALLLMIRLILPTLGIGDNPAAMFLEVLRS
ncbi:MAG: hypothetical protein HZB70_03095 [Candidatus Berkelbacteria bacterium]|nr:MAG: hypothetical protein HZB70_03095 [Candidatus Berkelbacteria bacterium]QQG51711.1 MAG: hypothetical protein HY845_04095 [Candidatus Berkelbacteria bacterium]